MNFWNVPWLELSIVVPLVGSIFVSRFSDPLQAFHRGLAFTGAAFACACLTCLGFYLNGPIETWSAQPYLFGWMIFKVDDLSAPLVAVVGLLHFLTAIATPRTKMRRFSLSWSLAAESIRQGTFGCQALVGTPGPWVLIALLAAGTIPPYIELLNRGRPTRVYLLHMGLFVGLLMLGWAFVNVDLGHETQTAWATIPLMLAIVFRCGTVPAHCWVTDWFEHASFGNALLFVTPLTGVYTAVRLVLPIAPDYVLQSISVMSLVTAVFAAGLGLVQNDARRFFAYLFVSHASLVLVGLELHTPISLTGSLFLWMAVTLSLGGFGLTLRAVEARYGRLSLTDFHGLYDNSPTLAVCFLLTGLACVGFPGTVGFVAADMLVDGAIAADLWVGIVMVAAAALNGIAVVRVYFLLFTGKRHASTVSMNIGARERFALLTLATLILGGGLVPQPGVTSRFKAATAILEQRKLRAPRAEPAEPKDSMFSFR